jgi:glycosyltransferase involved in cell wall biosynthesis
VQGPLYIEVGPLLTTCLTGVGRFVARLVGAVARQSPVCLVRVDPRTNVPPSAGADTIEGHEPGPVTAADLPATTLDLHRWQRELLRLTRPYDPRSDARGVGLFTWLRPPGRYFRRELGIFYDFTPLIMPWVHAHETVQAFRNFFATDGSYHKAVAISQSTKADARWLCRMPPEDVVAAYPGPSLCLDEHLDARPVARRSDVILVVSTLEQRKNGPFVLDWFMKSRAVSPGMELWWVGPRGWWAPAWWQSELSRLGRGRGSRGQRVRFLGMVSDQELCRLYRQATFCIYPSLYEGFGFPVLDALLHGTPVLSSYNSSLQEFAGPGVFYFDACDAESLERACRELLATGPAPVSRGALRQTCSWDALAQTVLDLAG